MSAEILRKAAALMRERAEAATPRPWVAQGTMIVASPGPTAKYVSDCFDEPGASEADAEHIASWHPAVALAVADWLDGVAAEWERWPGPALTRDEPALAVARAYLGEGGD